MRPVGKSLRLAILLPCLLAVTLAALGWRHTSKAMPPGTVVTGAMQPLDPDALRLFVDTTAADLHGNPLIDRSIHARMLEHVRNARDFLVLDYFRFNDQAGPTGQLHYQDGLQPVSHQLREALLALRARQPALPILVLLDPGNDYYRGTIPDDFAALAHAGIDIIVTDLDPLRDSNPLYGSLWRLAFKWWLAPDAQGGWGNPLDAAGPSLPLAALLRIPQAKAAHRRVLLTGDGNGSLVGLVGSTDPHDASSSDSGTALELAGEALRPLLDSELAIARQSGWDDRPFDAVLAALPSPPPPSGDAQASIVTEGAIGTVLLAALADTTAGDQLDIAQLHLSERRLVEALLDASRRGVAIRIILDPASTATGFGHAGVPNRQVASELVFGSDGAIKVRWYRTHGERFRAGLVAIRRPAGLWLSIGSASLTRRSLDNYNLEANAVVTTPRGSALDAALAEWFDALWYNRPGRIEYTADSDLYADPSQGRYWLYRLMEATGLSTF